MVSICVHVPLLQRRRMSSGKSASMAVLVFAVISHSARPTTRLPPDPIMTSLRLFRHSIKNRIIFVVLVVFLAGIWSLSFYAAKVLRQDMEKMLGEQQMSTVSIIATNINAEMLDRIAALETIAQELDASILARPRELQSLLERRPLLQHLFNGGIFVADLDGTGIADVPLSSNRIGVNYMDRDFMVAALKEGKSAIGRPVKGRALHAPVFVTAIPVRDVQGKVIGVFAGVTNLHKPNFLDRIFDSTYGKTGGHLLVAPQHGLIVTASDKKRVMEARPATGINPILDHRNQGYEGSDIFVNPSGVEVLSSSKGVPIAGWYAATTLPTSEAFAPVQAMQDHMLRAAIFLTLLAGVIIWWMLRRELAGVVDAAKALDAQSRSGHPMQPLPIKGQDEVGQLIGGFNGLLKTLEQREDALKESGELATQQARRAQALLDLPKLSASLDEQTFMQRSQEMAEDLTGSSISFVHFVAEDKETIELVTWSRRTLAHYCHAAFDKHYPVSRAGIWADALRQRQPVVFNDYIAYANRQGLPEGHAELSRLISVPVIENDKVVMITGVGNKAKDYTEFDVETVLLIASNVWHIVQRNRSEKKLALQYQHLEHLVEERTSELATAKGIAERANQSKSRFLAAASHDLRQPLAALSLFVGLLKQKVPADCTPILLKTDVCIENLTELLTDLLDISKLEAGVVTPQVVDFSVDDLLRGLHAIYQGEAQAKGLRLRVRRCAVFSRTDPLLLKRVLGNLINNAIRYTDQGGVLIACRYRQGTQWIEVWDTGVGIAADQTKVVFEEFYQLGDPARNQGSGLGLAIVAKSAALLGLKVCVNSVPGRGSMFAIELPPGTTTQTRSPTLNATATPARRIGLVEDHPQVLAALVLALENLGHTVLAGTTGAQMLQCLGNLAPDIVISDYRLAGGSTGLDVIEAARTRFSATLPAFVITGDTDPEIIASLAAKDIPVHFKPLPIEVLQGHIQRATEGRGRETAFDAGR